MTRKFWLDGGYDRELVEGCRLHPDHGWITLRLGDVFGEDYRWPDDKMTVCKVCAVPRCGGSELDECDLPRHHTEDHLTPSGESWPVGGSRLQPAIGADHGE